MTKFFETMAAACTCGMLACLCDLRPSSQVVAALLGGLTFYIVTRDDV